VESKVFVHSFLFKCFPAFAVAAKASLVFNAQFPSGTLNDRCSFFCHAPRKFLPLCASTHQKRLSIPVRLLCMSW